MSSLLPNVNPTCVSDSLRLKKSPASLLPMPPRAPAPPASPHVALGARVRSAREAIGLTQRQLADQIQYDPVHLSRTERGLVLPRGRYLSALARALGCSEQWILHGKSEALLPGADQYPNRAELRKLRAFQEAPAPVREYLLAIRNDGGDLTIDEWLAELRAAERAHARGQPLWPPPGAEDDLDPKPGRRH